MAHGTEDYANVRPKITTYTLTDMAELAERLGAVPSIDRLGDTIFIDNFEDGLCKWNVTTTGTGATVTESGKWSQHGGFSVKIHLPADATAQAVMQRSCPFPVSSMIGLEFNATSDEHLTNFIGMIDFYTSQFLIRFAMKFDVPNGNVYLLNPLGNWQLVSTGIYIDYASGIFHRGKFVADLPNLIFRKYATSTLAVDLRSYSPFITSDLTKAHMSISFYLYGNAAGEIDIYFDSVIVTQNEP